MSVKKAAHTFVLGPDLLDLEVGARGQDVHQSLGLPVLLERNEMWVQSQPTTTDQAYNMPISQSVRQSVSQSVNSLLVHIHLPVIWSVSEQLDHGIQSVSQSVDSLLH